MTYYIRDNLPPGPVLGERFSTINDMFLSSYALQVYAGCEFGCPYCDGWAYYPRPLNEVVQVPLDLPQRLASELQTVDRGDLIGLTLTDPYQPVEQTYRITRQVLQMFADVGQPCLVMTKGLGVLEDIPILQSINQRSLAVVMMTILTLAPHMAEQLEGKAPPPALRLEALATLKRAGIPVGAALMPLLPYVNDTNYTLTNVLRALADIEVDFVVWDYLYIPNKSHFLRINELVPRLGSYPTSYYRDIYGEQTLPDKRYRDRISNELLYRCDQLTLNARPRHQLFEGKLRPANEAALLLKHYAFIDSVQERPTIARMHHELADNIYQGRATPQQMQASPLWPSLQRILGTEAGVEDGHG